MTAAVANSSGPSFAVHGWVAIIIIGGAVAAALGAIWKVVWPVVKAARLVLARWSVLEDIAYEFRANGRPSLPDVVHKISATQDEMAARLVIVEGKVKEIRHDVIDVAGLPTLASALATTPTVVGALSALVDEIKALRATPPGT